MNYTRNIYLPRAEVNHAAHLCAYQPVDESECFSEKEPPITYTAEFPNGYSVDVKVCGVPFEENGCNTAWTEAVLFKNGFEVCCTEPCEGLLGPWVLTDGDKEFTVNVFCKEDIEKMDPIILLVGPSGSGKSTIADILEKQFNKKQVVSYTTRPSRGVGDVHYFVSTEEFAEIKDELCAYTLYNGNEYGANSDEVEASDIYVIDPAGVQFFIDHYKGIRPYRVFTLACDPKTCFDRMKARGDTEEAARERVENDSIVFDNKSMNFECGNTHIDVSDITAEQAARFIMTLVNEESSKTPYFLTGAEEISIYRKVDRHFLECDIKLHLEQKLEEYKDDGNINGINVVQELIEDPDCIADYVEHAIEHSDSYYDAYWTCVDYCIADEIENMM